MLTWSSIDYFTDITFYFTTFFDLHYKFIVKDPQLGFLGHYFKPQSSVCIIKLIDSWTMIELVAPLKYQTVLSNKLILFNIGKRILLFSGIYHWEQILIFDDCPETVQIANLFLFWCSVVPFSIFLNHLYFSSTARFYLLIIFNCLNTFSIPFPDFSIFITNACCIFHLLH